MKLFNQVEKIISFRSSFTVVGCIILFTIIGVSGANSQNIQITENNTNSNASVFSEIDPSTLGLNLKIQLYNYPGRKGNGVPVDIKYSSKFWNIQYTQTITTPPPDQRNITDTTPEYCQHSFAGWTSSLSFPRWAIADGDGTYGSNGMPVDLNFGFERNDSYWVVPKLFIRMPNDEVIELRRGDWSYEFLYLRENPYIWIGDFFAVDGSGLRYNTSTKTLYLPDGSRYIAENTNVGFNVFIDRNGNKITKDLFNLGLITDTLGRQISDPMMIASSTTVAGDKIYSLPSINQSTINYTFRWRNLSDVRSNNTLPLRHISDQVGPSGNPLSPSLFYSDSETSVSAYTTELFNPVVLHEISLPDGTYYRFNYNVWGEMDKITYPSGGYERFRYDTVSGTSLAIFPYYQANRGVVERWISKDGTLASEVRWQYTNQAITPISGSHHYVIAAAPDNTKTERLFYSASSPFSPFGSNSLKIGLLAEERTYNSVGTMVKRSIKDYQLSGPQGPMIGNPIPGADRDPRVVKEVEILLDTGLSPALARTIEYQYNNELNVQFVREYTFAEVTNRITAEAGLVGILPRGNLIRTAEYTYKKDGEYAKFKDLVASTKVTDENGRLAEFTEISYDEIAPQYYSGQPVGWTDPGSLARGNATSMKRWVDSNNYVVVRSSYDMFGNEISTTNELNKTVDKEFSSVNQYAYLTKVSLPAPDPSNDKGANEQSIVRTTYDFATGLILSETNQNNQIASYEYNDSMNRLTKVNRPDGGWTAYYFGSQPNSFYLKTVTAQDAVQSMESYTYFDGLMRPVRQSDNEGGSWRVVDTLYDNLGREWRTSNPFRSNSQNGPVNPPDLWTTNQFDTFGRIIAVTAPDGGVVTTNYSGNTVVSTDQSNKTVKTISDALGRSIQVIEAPSSANPYLTNYVYDAVGNVRRVSQESAELGVTQQRFFMYDLLGRLVRAKHPEQSLNPSLNLYDEITGNSDWAMSFEYDKSDNLKKLKDARGVIVNYDYDTFGRLTQRSYVAPSGVTPTPTVNYYYDGANIPGGIPNSKGSLTKISSSVAEFTNDEFDVMGRIKKTTQTVDSKSYIMRYDYNYGGNVIAQTYPSGRVIRNSFDRASRLMEITGQASGNSFVKKYASQISYAPHWGISSLKLGNGLRWQINFNENLQRSQIKLGWSIGDSSVLKLENFYKTSTIGNNGNLHKQIITIPGRAFTQNFIYDDYDRLHEANENQGNSWKQRFVYDRFGNRRLDVNNTTPGMIGVNPLINAFNNRLQNHGYDASGNMTSDTVGHTYSYNADNLLASFDNGSTTYEYGGNDKRVKKTSNGVANYYVYNVVGQMIAEYTTGQPPKGETHYLTSDQMGSARVITNQYGQIKERRDLLPFGEYIEAQYGNRSGGAGYVGIGNIRQAFTGIERDIESNLDYFGARYYASSTGRFTSPDPLQASGIITSPQTWNRYAYVTNNPLKYIDIGGLLRRKKNGEFEFRAESKLKIEHGGAPGVSWKGKLGYLVADDGTRIQAFKSTDRDRRADTDCHGLTFADGEYWINNDQVEALLKGDGYVETTTPEEGDVAVYYDVDTSGNESVVHTTTVTARDASGNITEVAGLGGIQTRSSTSTPERGFGSPATGQTRQIKYFRSNNRTAAERKANVERAKAFDKQTARQDKERKKREEKETRKREKRETKEAAKKRKEEDKREKRKTPTGNGSGSSEQDVQPEA